MESVENREAIKRVRVYLKTPVDIFQTREGDVLRALSRYKFEIVDKTRNNGSIEVDIYNPHVRSELGLRLAGGLLAANLKEIDPYIQLWKGPPKNTSYQKS